MSVSLEWQIFVGFIGLSLLFIPLERFFGLHRQSIFRAGYTSDTFHYIINCLLGKLTDLISLWIGFTLLRNLFPFNGFKFVSEQPFWLQFIEIVIISDFFAYWIHRLFHHVPWLWRFHAVHHSAENMDWLVNVRLHPVDKILGDCAQFIPIFFLGFSETVFFSYTIFLGLQGFLNHSNVRINIGCFRWLIATPEFHHWHHCQDKMAIDSNFAPHTLLFDRLFGTLYLPTDKKPKQYGVLEIVSNTNYWQQLIYPFQRK